MGSNPINKLNKIGLQPTFGRIQTWKAIASKAKDCWFDPNLPHHLKYGEEANSFMAIITFAVLSALW